MLDRRPRRFYRPSCRRVAAMSADAAALTMASFKKSPEPALVVEAWKEIEVVQEWGVVGQSC